jgi:hypothetical protein
MDMIYIGKFVIGSLIVRRDNGKLGEFHFSYNRTPFSFLTPDTLRAYDSIKDIGVSYELWIGWVMIWIDYYYQKKDILPYSDMSFEDYIRGLSEK